MLENRIIFIETLSQQISDYSVDETKASYSLVDCYPYSIQGIIWGLLLSAILWGGAIAAFMLLG